MGSRSLTRLTKRLAFVPLLLAAVGIFSPMTVAHADSYVAISGSGSTWSSNAVDQWRRDVEQYGMRINFVANGSSAGRNDYTGGQVEFAVSEIPYGVTDNGAQDPPPLGRPFAYMPIVAGGTSFMYNLKIGGRRVTDLRLNGDTISKIFTGVITNWSDPVIHAQNPALTLPARKIVPVIRSDGSGTSAQFTRWMAHEYPNIWNAYCQKAGRSTPCGQTSNYPNISGLGFIAAAQSVGVAAYVQQDQNEGAITYVEYSYPRELGFPVVKVENAAHYFVSPTAQNVAVALLKARINQDSTSTDYLTSILDDVYSDADPRAYPLSSYSYMIVPTSAAAPMTTDKGKTLGAFAYYFLCQGQQRADDLGYSPLPQNLVQAGLEQVRKIPGVNVQSIDISKCNNPTFSTDGTNTLAKNAPPPAPCDKEGPTQCVGGRSAGVVTSTDPGSGQPPVSSNPSSPTTNVSPGPLLSGGVTAPPATTGGSGIPQPAPQSTANASLPAIHADDPQPPANSEPNAAQPIAVSLASDGSFGDSGGAVAIVAVLLLALLVAPPVVGQALRRRARP